MDFHTAIEIIRTTQGNNAKMEALERAVKEVPHFAEFLEYVYSDKYKYNLRSVKIENIGTSSLDERFVDFQQLLHHLNARKITGNKAQEAATTFVSWLNKEGQELFQKTLNRTLDFGLNTKSINKVVPALLPSNAYMRCSGYSGNTIQKWFDRGEDVLAQEKMDGMFVVINAENHTIRTRNGKYFDPDLFEEVWKDLELNSMMGLPFCLHGEVITFDNNGKQEAREISNGNLNSALKKNTPLNNYKVFLWDCVDTETEKGKPDTTPYHKRFYTQLRRLQDLKVLRRVETRIVNSFEDIHDFYREILGKGGEGLVIKRADSIWENKTSKDQLKMKNEVDLDLKIVGYNAGRGKFQGQIGSVICETSDGKLKVDVSGMNDATRLYITENADALLGSILAVKANSIMRNEGGQASLFLPRFVELREDKTEADTFERVEELFQ